MAGMRQVIAEKFTFEVRSREQRNADNLRLGVELGGVAKLAAQQRYSNQNSVVAQGRKAAAIREPSIDFGWKNSAMASANRDICRLKRLLQHLKENCIKKIWDI